jgi:hypothetical protein
MACCRGDWVGWYCLSRLLHGIWAGILLHEQLDGGALHHGKGLVLAVIERDGPVSLQQELLQLLLGLHCDGERQCWQLWFQFSYRAATVCSLPHEIYRQGWSMAVSALEPWSPAIAAVYLRKLLPDDAEVG